MPDTFFVYAWTRPDTGNVFYIGKGREQRDTSLSSRSRYFMAVVNKVRRLGLEPTVSRIADGLSEQEAFDLERQEIARVGRRDLGHGPLVNRSDGGEGASGVLSILTAMHMAHPGVRNTSGYKGVSRATGSDGWVSQIKTDGKRRIGTYATKELAALAYDRAAMKTWPEGCYLNFPNLTHENREVAALHGPGPQAGLRKNNESGFKGVFYCKTKGKWAASISIGKQHNHIGYFADAEGAALAYDAVAHDRWGINCYLNFPDRVGEVAPVQLGPRAGLKVGPHARNTSGYKGVSFFKRTGKWVAQIMVCGKTRGLGYFQTAEEAARAYDAAAYAAHGSDCFLNFPERLIAAEPSAV